MCDLGTNFILCTCDGSKEKIDWVLERQDLSLASQHRRGRAVVPRYSSKENDQIEFFLFHLNSRNCFDFDYDKREGDVLSLKIGPRQFRFRVQQATWNIDLSTSLHGWRRQMVRERIGFIESS